MKEIEELDRIDIINMLRGTTPSYSVMKDIPKELGSYCGGFVDEWKWNISAYNIEYYKEYSDEYLLELYYKCNGRRVSMNIFEGANFGDPYKTTDGNKVFFLHRLDDGSVSCLVGNEKNYGFSILEEDEIESRWQESISEEELDKLALEYCNKQWATNYKSLDEITDDLDLQAICDFKAGYRKAKGL